MNQPGYLPDDGPYAVATVEEMRQDARNLVEDAAQEPGWSEEWKAAREDARTLPESGGTVGPLPDGYVIDVRRVTWNDLSILADTWPRPCEHVRAARRDPRHLQPAVTRGRVMPARIHHHAARNVARDRIVDRAVKVADMRKVRPVESKREQKR